MGRLFAVAAFFVLLPMQDGLAQDERDKLMRFGEQLAQECMTCHRRDGKDDGIPGIVFMSEEDLVAALMLYKTGRRQNKVMVSVAASLDDTQMKALAVYIAGLGTSSRAEPAPPRPKPAR